MSEHHSLFLGGVFDMTRYHYLLPPYLPHNDELYPQTVSQNQCFSLKLLSSRYCITTRKAKYSKFCGGFSLPKFFVQLAKKKSLQRSPFLNFCFIPLFVQEKNSLLVVAINQLLLILFLLIIVF